ncbi:MAG: hypothetical protein MUF22_07960 [Chitinispirillaceae bacterium]|jgi:hypothetical protein|nr:hypothetical protein [Chitinispirillaceae bacterium]
MKGFKNVLRAGVVVLALAGSSFAGPWALFGSFASLGSTTGPMGGVRYSLSSDICIDIGAGAKLGYEDSTANNFSLYADAFFVGQTMGVFASVLKDGVGDVVPTFGLAYCIERSITDKIVLGVSPVVASYTVLEGNGIDILPGVNVYTVISF